MATKSATLIFHKIVAALRQAVLRRPRGSLRQLAGARTNTSASTTSDVIPMDIQVFPTISYLSLRKLVITKRSLNCVADVHRWSKRESSQLSKTKKIQRTHFRTHCCEPLGICLLFVAAASFPRGSRR